MQLLMLIPFLYCNKSLICYSANKGVSMKIITSNQINKNRLNNQSRDKSHESWYSVDPRKVTFNISFNAATLPLSGQVASLSLEHKLI